MDVHEFWINNSAERNVEKTNKCFLKQDDQSFIIHDLEETKDEEAEVVFGIGILPTSNVENSKLRKNEDALVIENVDDFEV